jgi:hypothetical protein
VCWEEDKGVFKEMQERGITAGAFNLLCDLISASPDKISGIPDRYPGYPEYPKFTPGLAETPLPAC